LPKIKVVTREGQEIVVEATSGLSVMENIRNAGVEEMLALCGGVKSCATCHVFVDERWMQAVGAAHSDETDLLEASSHIQQNSRLSCQIPMTEVLDGLKVTLAPED
jgi:2Fe-2S ferredoxin